MGESMKSLALATLLGIGSPALAEEGREKAASLHARVDQGLRHESAAVEKYHLTRFADQKQLERAIKQGLVVRVPDSGAGFLLDSRIGDHAKINQEDYRYARPYTRRFILRLGQAYDTRSAGHPFVVSSLVRDCVYQMNIAGSGNYNAASCELTSHTAGTTVDILVNSVPKEHLSWFRKVLLDLEKAKLILATEEHGQPVFHVMVLPPYANYKTENVKKAGHSKPKKR